MFGRRRSPNPRPDDGSGLGIGAVVRVVDADRGERWADEPFGVIVAPGASQLGGTQRTWTIAFEHPAYTTDGRGPFERATVLSRQLVPVEAAPETEA